MSSRVLIPCCWIAAILLILALARGLWDTMAAKANPLLSLIVIVVVGGILGVLFVTMVLPRLGDAVGEAMYSSGEQAAPDARMKAVARISAGDYEGAIEEYKKLMGENQEDPFPVSEIGKLMAEKLGEPDQALVFLQEHLEAREWTAEDAAFLMFRIVEVYQGKEDFAGARDVLEQVCSNFPDTRHSANARHKLKEIDQQEFKALQDARAKAATASAAEAAASDEADGKPYQEPT